MKNTTNAAITYFSGYKESNGQPENGYQEHTNKRAAIARARELRTWLPDRSGGRAYAYAIRTAGVDGECIDLPSCKFQCACGFTEELLWEWYEHPEGGYITMTEIQR